MPRWSRCRVRIWCDDGAPDHEDDDADVAIEDGQIVLSFMDDDGPVVLAGRELSPGSFELVARSRLRRATLERSEGASVLTGAWRERERGGTWRIELGEIDGASRDGGEPTDE